MQGCHVKVENVQNTAQTHIQNVQLVSPLFYIPEPSVDHPVDEEERETDNRRVPCDCRSTREELTSEQFTLTVQKLNPKVMSIGHPVDKKLLSTINKNAN